MSALDRLIDAGLAGESRSLPARHICSCGCVEPHVVAYRDTSDCARLGFWSDGSITRSGAYLRGLGTPRSEYAVAVRANALWAIRDDVSLYAVAEIPAVVRVAEATFKSGSRFSCEADRRATIRARAFAKLGRTP